MNYRVRRKRPLQDSLTRYTRDCRDEIQEIGMLVSMHGGMVKHIDRPNALQNLSTSISAFTSYRGLAATHLKSDANDVARMEGSQ